MTTKVYVFLSCLFFFASCDKEEEPKITSQNQISFKIQEDGTSEMLEIENGIWTGKRYLSNPSSGLLDLVLEVENLNDSLIMMAELTYQLPVDASLSGFDIFSITFLRKESLDNVVLRDPQIGPFPVYDYPNTADIVEKLFPLDGWNLNEDLKVLISFNNGGFDPNQTADFPNSNGDFFRLTKVDFSESDTGLGTVQLEGEFECKMGHSFSGLEKFEISEGTFSAVLDLESN